MNNTNTPHPPQQILVRVDCKERLPSQHGQYMTSIGILNYVPDYNRWFIIDYVPAPLFWYEPATAIVLTVEEYEKLKQKQFQLGYLDARSEMEEEDFDL